jgi:hypothetical protein
MGDVILRHPRGEERMVNAALFVWQYGDCKTGGDEENNCRNPNAHDFFHRKFLSPVERYYP